MLRLKNPSWAFLIICVFLIVLLSSCKKEGPTPKVEERAAVITFVSGEKNKLERDKKVLPMKGGDLVFAGDFLETGQKGRVDLQLSQKLAIRIGENTRVEVERLLQKENGDLEDNLKLPRGSIFAKISKEGPHTSFRVGTPALVASVRGTAFFLEAKENEAKLAVTEGKVEVVTPEGEKREVAEGEKLERKETGELEQEKISSQEFKKLTGLFEIHTLDAENFQLLKEKFIDLPKLKESQMPLNLENLQKGFSIPSKRDIGKEDLKELPEKGKKLIPQESQTAPNIKESVEEQKVEAQKKIEAIKEEVPSKNEAQQELQKRKEELDKLKKNKLF